MSATQSSRQSLNQAEADQPDTEVLTHPLRIATKLGDIVSSPFHSHPRIEKGKVMIGPWCIRCTEEVKAVLQRHHSVCLCALDPFLGILVGYRRTAGNASTAIYPDEDRNTLFDWLQGCPDADAQAIIATGAGDEVFASDFGVD